MPTHTDACRDGSICGETAHCPPDTTFTPPLEAGAREQALRVNGILDYICRMVGDQETRLVNAADAGAELAKAVYDFIEDPQGYIGTAALRDAYQAFMGQHSSGFTNSAREATSVHG